MSKRAHARRKAKQVKNDDEYNALLLLAAEDTSEDSEEIYYRSDYRPRYRLYYRNEPVQNDGNDMVVLENNEENKEEDANNLQEHQEQQTPPRQPRQFVQQVHQPIVPTYPNVHQRLLFDSPPRVYETPPRPVRKRVLDDFDTPSPQTAHDLRFALAAGEAQQRQINIVNNINRGSGAGLWNQEPPVHVIKYRAATLDDMYREIIPHHPASWIEQTAQPWGYTEDTEEDKISDQEALAIQDFVRRENQPSNQQRIIAQHRHPLFQQRYKPLSFRGRDGAKRYIAMNKVPANFNS
jgi:hypothetical protein